MEKTKSIIKVAIKNITSNRLRSGLTMLGLIIGIIMAYVKKNSNNANMTNFESMKGNEFVAFSNSNEQRKDKKTTLRVNGKVKAALVEQIEPHASYYLEEVYVEENQFVSKDSNILKYTNGTYLTATYDCVVTELNLPELEGKLIYNIKWR